MNAEKFCSAIQVFSDRNKLPVNLDLLNYIAEAATSIEVFDGLFHMWQSSGDIDYSEAGCGVRYYLRSVLTAYLQLMGGGWEIDTITFDDEEESAEVVFVSVEGQNEKVVFEDFDGDWVPVDTSEKMKVFSSEFGDKTIMTFHSEDDPYLMLALPHVEAKKLESDIEKYTKKFDY